VCVAVCMRDIKSKSFDMGMRDPDGCQPGGLGFFSEASRRCKGLTEMGPLLCRVSKSGACMLGMSLSVGVDSFFLPWGLGCVALLGLRLWERQWTFRALSVKGGGFMDCLTVWDCARRQRKGIGTGNGTTSSE